MLIKQFNILLEKLFDTTNFDKNLKDIIRIHETYFKTTYSYIYLLYYVYSGYRSFFQFYKALISNTNFDIDLLFRLLKDSIKDKELKKLPDNFPIEYIIKLPKIQDIKETQNLLKSIDPFITTKDVYFLLLAKYDINDLLTSLKRKETLLDLINFDSGLVVLD